jgi:hypothetical protein
VHGIGFWVKVNGKTGLQFLDSLYIFGFNSVLVTLIPWQSVEMILRKKPSKF